MAKKAERNKKITGKPVSKVNKPKTKSKGKYKDNISDHKYISHLYKVLLVAILAIVFYPPYLRGLFFESEYIKAEIFVFIIFAVYWIYKILKKEKLVFETPIDYASFGFVIVYLLSVIAAVSVDLAKGEWLKYCMYFAVFFMLTDIASVYKNRIRVLWVITISAVGVCILGIDALAGCKFVTALNNVFDRFYLKFGMDISERGTFFDLIAGGRINSTLQYPNTLAAYLMAAFFVVLALMLLSESRVKRIIASCAGFIFLVTFVFTLSRGAYIIFPFMLILFIVVLPKGVRIKGIIYSLIPIISSLPSIIKIYTFTGSQSERYTTIWLWISLGLALCLVMSFISEYMIAFLKKVSWKVYIYILGALFAATCVGIVMIFTVKQPLTITLPLNSEADSTVISRSVMLKPGMDYRMSLNVEGKYDSNNNSEYSIIIRSRNENDILFGQSTAIVTENGIVDSEIVQKDIDFRVPSDSRVIYIYFYNNTRGTDITFSKCVITEEKAGMLSVDVPLKYKYIPEMLVSRMQDILVAQSNLARIVFYKDGLKIFGDHWLIGAGGGAWSLLYSSYQSYFYESSQAHNYFLQLAVETGIVGLLVLMLLLFSIIFIFIKQRYIKRIYNSNQAILQAILLIILITLLLHAGIDFDFSFPAMMLVMWEILALFNAGIKDIAAKTGRPYLLPFKVLKASPAFGMLFSILLIILTTTIFTAINQYNKGALALKRDNLDLSIWHFQRAAELNPARPEYKYEYSDLVLQKGKKASAEERTRADKWIQEAVKQSKYDASLLPLIAGYYYLTGQIEEGIKTNEKAVELRPFRKEEWEKLTNAYNSVFKYYLENNDTKQSLEIVNHGINTINWAAKVNERNRNPFIFNAKTSQTLERFAYYKDNSDNAASLDNLLFYSLPALDIDNNGIPDQWHSTSQDEYILENENNMLKIDKITSNRDSYIESRSLLLKANSKYRIDLELYNENEIDEIQYQLIVLNEEETDILKLQNQVYSATVTTTDEIVPSCLRIFINKDSIIKSLRIEEIV